MRILLTSHQFLPKFGFGTEKLTFECGRELLRRGHEVFVLTAEPATEELPHEAFEDYEYEGLKVRSFGTSVGATQEPLRYEFDNPSMSERAREYIRRVEPDIVHSWHVARLSGGMLRVAREEGVPVVFTATDFWSVCRVIHLRRADTGELCDGPNRLATNCLRCYIARSGSPESRKARYLKKSDLELAAYARLADAPVVRNSSHGKRLRAISDRVGFLRDTLNATDRVIAPTRLTRDVLIRNGVNPRLIRVSRYGIDTSHITRFPRSPEHPPTVRFGFMGGLVRHKGVHNLVKAFRTLPDDAKAELKVFGDPGRDPAYFAELQALAGGDVRVRFPGAFPGEKVGEVLGEVDVLVVPSAWYENTPLVIYEAFASGTPVVGTDLGGISEVIEHGENGLLFAVDDADDLASQLRRFVEEPDLIGEMRGKIGPARTISDSVDDLEKLYAEALGARKPAKGSAART